MSLMSHKGIVNILWFSIMTSPTFENICQWRYQLFSWFTAKLWFAVNSGKDIKWLNWTLKQSGEQGVTWHVSSKFPSCSNDNASLNDPSPWEKDRPCIHQMILWAQSYDTTRSASLMPPFFQYRGLGGPADLFPSSSTDAEDFCSSNQIKI